MHARTHTHADARRRTHARTHAHARKLAHARKHTHTHARARVHTHTRTHTRHTATSQHCWSQARQSSRCAQASWLQPLAGTSIRQIPEVHTWRAAHVYLHVLVALLIQLHARECQDLRSQTALPCQSCARPTVIAPIGTTSATLPTTNFHAFDPASPQRPPPRPRTRHPSSTSHCRKPPWSPFNRRRHHGPSRFSCC